MDIFDKTQARMGPLGQYQQVGEGYFFFPKLEGELGPHMKFNGKDVLNWSLNNYIGLGNHPEVRKADAEAAAKYGMAYPMGARMMSGQTKYHEELENKLANFVGKQSGFLLNYGYQGVISILDSMLDRKDVVVYDSDCHACIIDGLRLTLAKRFVFPHNDIDNCAKQLERATRLAEKQGGGVLVITEGVFGMVGDLGNLKAITDLKSKFNFRLFVDDAHGFGTMGKTGAGTGEHFGVQDKIDLYFSTFAKSMAGIGAFIASTPEVIQYLRYNMRSQIYAKSLPMPMVIGGLKRLELLQTKPELRENLWKVVDALQKGFRDNGFDLGKTQSCVTPVYMHGTLIEATNLLIDLRENFGLFCSVVIYPVVPKGTILLRIIPTADHTLEDVEKTIEAFKACRDKLTNKVYDTEEFTDLRTLIKH